MKPIMVNYSSRETNSINNVARLFLPLQIFVFSLNAKNDDWRFYNWTKVTTVVMVGYLDMKLVCQAHKYGARAITIGNYRCILNHCPN